MEPIYAVVDLETTGTDPQHDKIIQFGCVLIQNNEIIGSLATDVNPLREIPQGIQQLTGITNSQVKKAPTLEEVAGTIISFLHGTIFVAHNIAFDYRFLSGALQKLGYEPLTLPGIDTVSLAQILYPQEVSFRLNDLAQKFNLLHDHPHQAASDALVTGELFLKLQEKLANLPLLTLKQLAQLSWALPFQTGALIEAQFAQKNSEGQVLDPALEIVGELVLRKKSLAKAIADGGQSYPFKKKGKLRLFPPNFSFRKAQGRMMNLVYQFFTDEFPEKIYLLEAQAGLGKTFGYLFPLSFLASNQQPVVIATPTIILQQQLLADVTKINQRLPQPIRATLIKSPRHYLDLQKFVKTLKETGTKQVSLYKMMLLVWLTETETGDFSELNLLRIKDLYFQTIACSAVAMPQKENPYGQVDFSYWVKKRALNSNVLITNHAFLLEEAQRQDYQLPKAPYLVIDEAQHLPENLLKAATQTFDCQAYLRQLDFCQLTIRENKSALSTAETYLFLEVVETLTQKLTTLEKYYLDRKTLDYPEIYPESTYMNEALPVLQLVDSIATLMKDLRQLTPRLTSDPTTSPVLKLVLGQLLAASGVFTEFYHFATGEKLQWFAKSSQGGLQLVYCLTAVLALDKQPWFQRYEKVLLTGATFSLGRRNYLQERLALTTAKTSRLQNQYDYPAQVRFYLPENLSAENRNTYLVAALKDYLAEVPYPLLVLFSAQDQLKKVFYAIQETAFLAQREIFAQGINGTKEKLLKRFSLSDNGILLGNETFWEGIDLPGKDLPVIFVAKLPFENPQRPLVAARYQALEKAGKNPFYEAALPDCSLHLQQAFGRLLRSSEDRGCLVLFDERFTKSRYSPQLAKNLPQSLKGEELPLTALPQAILDFIEGGVPYEKT
ncbi:helicase C-terminal domain-containing protein [Enterococcus nangangensis]|uniref:helicase C-terminal domain-containing protein n=1 Tax=Enterococcus nangangensis TaxID=2559926 RepID=UPI0010F6E39F|nr:helicase C-terminal domain-containing protein [Enterococcus nangangensis]